MSRTACTEPQCLYNGALYLYLYLYSPYGPYSLYRPSVPVQRCTVPLPIPLLPLCAVQPVQSLSALTMVQFTFLFMLLLAPSGLGCYRLFGKPVYYGMFPYNVQCIVSLLSLDVTEIFNIRFTNAKQAKIIHE